MDVRKKLGETLVDPDFMGGLLMMFGCAFAAMFIVCSKVYFWEHVTDVRLLGLSITTLASAAACFCGAHAVFKVRR